MWWRCQQQDVLVRSRRTRPLEHVHAQQRPVLEIKRPVRQGPEPVFQRTGVRRIHGLVRGQGLEAHRHRRMDPLDGTAGDGVKGRAQRRVAIDQPLEGEL